MNMVSEEEVELIHKELQNAAKTIHDEQVTNDDDDVFGEGSEMKNCVVTGEEDEVDSVNIKTPPFLKKTFEMVEDPESDPIVSWSATRDSFVVWDSLEFSKILLPKYFKHNNFNSFIRQLNTYGFRKVDLDRWEFANEAFQEGKKHLLKKIKRRSKGNKLHQGSFNSMKPGVEDGVEKLKKDQNLLKVEILKLKQQLENSHIELSNVLERIRCAELKQHQMLFFLTRMVKKHTLVEQLNEKIKRKEELDGVDVVKRRRLLGTQFNNRAMDTTPNVEHRHQDSQQLSILQSELIELLSEIVNTRKMDELCSSKQGLRTIDSAASMNDASFAYDVMSEKLMGESSVVDEEVYVSDSNIYLELENLLSNTTDWIGSPSELVGQTS